MAILALHTGQTWGGGFVFIAVRSPVTHRVAGEARRVTLLLDGLKRLQRIRMPRRHPALVGIEMTEAALLGSGIFSRRCLLDGKKTDFAINRCVEGVGVGDAADATPGRVGPFEGRAFHQFVNDI